MKGFQDLITRRKTVNIKKFVKSPLGISFSVCLLVLIAVQVNHFIRARTDGFTVEKIHSQLRARKEWEVKVSKKKLETVNKILEQPFHYLGKGFQCYAFLSKDGEYVLKFIRHQRLRLPKYLSLMPNLPGLHEFKQSKSRTSQKRMKQLFSSIKVAYESAAAETAFVYVHLNKTTGIKQHKKVTIFDKTGKKHFVELDNVEFILQKKADLLKPTLISLMEAKKVNEAEKRIDQIFDLLEGCAKKGIQDLDGALIRKDNLGFLKDKAIYIDGGKLVKKSPVETKNRFSKDLKRLRPLQSWLTKTYPELATYFLKRQEKALQEIGETSHGEGKNWLVRKEKKKAKALAKVEAEAAAKATPNIQSQETVASKK